MVAELLLVLKVDKLVSNSNPDPKITNSLQGIIIRSPSRVWGGGGWQKIAKPKGSTAQAITR